MIAKDKSVQYPHRYKMDATGIANVYELTPTPGTVYEEGTKLTANQLKDITECAATEKTCEDISI